MLFQKKAEAAKLNARARPCTEVSPADAFGGARPLRHRELVGFPGFVDCMCKGVPDTLVLDSGLQHDITLSASG
eukprot:SM000098S25114  [mRNA]  locus=s98:284552:285113:- [translate_table: standard]